MLVANARIHSVYVNLSGEIVAQGRSMGIHESRFWQLCQLKRRGEICPHQHRNRIWHRTDGLHQRNLLQEIDHLRTQVLRDPIEGLGILQRYIDRTLANIELWE